jgi:hypothetical protein
VVECSPSRGFLAQLGAVVNYQAILDSWVHRSNL